MVDIRNKKWTDEEFLEKRKPVLASWPTGKEVDLDEAIEYHKKLPQEKIWGLKVAKAEKAGEILVKVGLGHATIEQTLDHIKTVQEAGSDFLYVHTDTYTRKCKYEMAQKAIDESKRVGYSLLNGYPVVCHGVKKTRAMLEQAKLPVEAQSSADEEPMLEAEIELASGCTAAFQEDLQDLVMHSKNYPLDKRIENAQYISRLAAYYAERGAPILMIDKNVMNGYTPPSLMIVLGILSLLMTAEQGVKDITLSESLMGNVKQDVASLRAYRELGKEYLQRFGYWDIHLTESCWPYMGNWPRDNAQACGFAATAAVTAALTPLDYMYCKSVEEALGTTTGAGNAQALRLSKQILRSMKSEGPIRSLEIEEEKEAIKEEARCILDKTIEVGDGDPLRGEIKAVELGIIDIPFSSWTLAKGKVVGARDATGAMRYLETGNLPFTKEIIKRNRQKLAERKAKEHIKEPLDMVLADFSLYAKEIVGVKW